MKNLETPCKIWKKGFFRPSNPQFGVVINKDLGFMQII
jgi:hypothetical protein